jgi:hypothetical protein
MPSPTPTNRRKIEQLADTLADVLIDAHGDKLTGAERDEVSHVRQILNEIADGER